MAKTTEVCFKNIARYFPQGLSVQLSNIICVANRNIGQIFNFLKYISVVLTILFTFRHFFREEQSTIDILHTVNKGLKPHLHSWVSIHPRAKTPFALHAKI